MKQFLITIAGVLVGLTLFAVLVPFVLLGMIAGATRPAPTPAAAVLSLDLRGPISDQPPQSPLAFLTGRTQSVLGIEQALRRAETDNRVKGLFVRLPEDGLPPAAADELREAFKRFRANGKTITVHAQGLYAVGTVVSTYELAAASGDVWMQPGSSFQVTGLANEDLFFKRAFDRYGLQADYQQRYEYKNAVNPFLYDDYTPAHREAELGWMNSVYSTALADVAADRGRPVPAVKALIEAGPYLAAEAQARGLIDHVGQEAEAEAAALAKAGSGAKMVDFSDYASQPDGGSTFATGDKIAVIAAEGAILTGRSDGPSPLGGRDVIRSDDIAKAFYDAIDDKQVRAIVFRLSSPGGSDTASEQILAAVRAARAAGKPVVVSMGTYGASGGYWVSSDASEIVAQPATITGSIGVFGGKIVLGPALARFGLDMRGLSVGGDYAASSDSGAPMNQAQKAAFSAWMDKIYAGFVGRVAEGRRLPVARVQAIARGRVWTGVQAQALGLVDHLGGFYDAVDRAKALAGITGQARLQPFGAGRSPLDALQRMIGADAMAARLAAVGLDVTADPEARRLLAAAREARLRAEGATVLAPTLFP